MITVVKSEYPLGGDYRNFDTHLFCNETGGEKMVPALKRQRNEVPGGTGLVIGSGSLFSLLPELQLDKVFVVDANSAVLDFSQFIGNLILKNNTPDQVVRALTTDADKYPLLQEVKNSGVSMRYLSNFQLQEEAINFGRFHWTNKNRFTTVQSVLQTTEINYLQANITPPFFVPVLRELLGKDNQEITYLNLSNVHEWLKTMEFIRGWPLHNAATIQYASHEGVEAVYPSFPHIRIAKSLEDYSTACKNDEMSGMF